MAASSEAWGWLQDNAKMMQIENKIRIGLFLILVMVFLRCDRSSDNSSSEKADQDRQLYSDISSKEARNRLLTRINRNGDINDSNVPRPLVTLEEFFKGNNDYGSIGYNFYPDQPDPADFFRLFKTIRNKSEVVDVLVEVKDIEDPEGWPSADTIWIITSASVDDVGKWLGQRFRADDILIGFSNVSYKIENYKVPGGMEALGVWWD